MADGSGVVLFKGANGLGLAVDGDVEGGCGNAVNDVAFDVRYGDVSENDAGAGGESVAGLLRVSGGLRLLLRLRRSRGAGRGQRRQR